MKKFRPSHVQHFLCDRPTHSDADATQNAPVWRLGRLNSHRRTRHDKTVLSVSCLAWQCELHNCKLTCSDFGFSVGDSLELSGIQFTPSRQTRHRQDCFVGSGLAVLTGYNITTPKSRESHAAAPADARRKALFTANELN